MVDLFESGEEFEANEYEQKEYALLEDGEYELMVTESEFKDCRGGKRLTLTMEVISETGKGRKIWENLLWVHPSEKAVLIARETFSSLCKACGLTSVKASEELHNIPFKAKVGQEHPEGYKSRNVIEKYVYGESTGSAPKAAAATPVEKKKSAFA